jgi:hypothetical protein
MARGVLSQVPGLAGYMEAQEFDQQRQGGQLAQAAMLQGILSRQQAQQEEQELKGVLSQTGGDPAKAIQALVSTGNPRGLELAAKLKSMIPPPPQDRVVAPGSSIVGPNGEVKFTAPTKPDKPPTPPAIIQMTEMYASLPEGDPRKEILKKAIDAQTFGREDAIRLTAALRPAPQPVAPTVVEIADPQNPGKSIKIDAKTGVKIGDAPPRPAVEKALPGPLQKQLTEAAELGDATNRFVTTFKPEYGGKTITGGLGNTYGRIMGDDTGQAQWWQDYELHQSQVRNKLFGSALTAPEIAAWNKSAINPRMEPGQIKINLERRQKLENTALERLMKGATAGGYNKAQIEAFTGRPLSAPATPGASGGWSVVR